MEEIKEEDRTKQQHHLSVSSMISHMNSSANALPVAFNSLLDEIDRIILTSRDGINFSDDKGVKEYKERTRKCHCSKRAKQTDVLRNIEEVTSLLKRVKYNQPKPIFTLSPPQPKM